MTLMDIAAKITLDFSEWVDGIKKASEGARGLSDAFKTPAGASETLKNKISVLSEQYQAAQRNVEKLTDEFNKSVSETGATSQQTQELARRLSEAEKEADSLGKELKGLQEEAEQTGSRFAGLGEKIKNGLATAAKVTGAALGAMTSAGVAAATSITKSAVSNYADYEQLVGGVETLFGAGGKSVEEYAASVGKSVAEVSSEYNSLMAAQNAVLENANNAYKTAGLSANEYMETVTSFSASLLQSLGGDTETAAKVSDMAITDMADNANKMGSSIDSVVAAYQGFAKGQYQLLDNLKLG